MKFTVNRKALLSELSFVKDATEQRQTIPALSYLLAEAKGGRVLLTGTDLDATAYAEVEAEVETEGALCIPARRLHDIAKSLPGDDISFASLDNDRVAVESGRVAFKLAGLNRDSFAQVPSGSPKSVKLPAPAFREAVEQTAYAIDTDTHNRFQMQGLKFTLDKSGLKAVATDGHRLAMLTRPELGAAVNGTSVDVLIPRKVLSLASTHLAGGDGEISVAVDKNNVFFSSGTRRLAGRLLVGDFPAFEMMIPKGPGTRAVFDVKGLAAAVRRTQLVAGSDQFGRPVVLHLSRGAVEVSTQAAEIGEAKEPLDAEYDGEEVQLTFTNSYLLDALNSVTGEKVALEFKNQTSQVVLRPVAGDFSKLDLIVPRTR